MKTSAVDAEMLLGKASAFVYKLYKEKLPETILYHTYEHTVDVAQAADEIGRKSKLDEEELLLVQLAAWFHDTGFTETYDDHEEAGARIAERYLSEHGLPDEQVATVVELIRSTHSAEEPRNVMEEVLYDADHLHVTKKRKFFDYSERLRREWEHHTGRSYTDQQWAEDQLHFVTSVRFRTAYARDTYEKKRRRTLARVQKRLAGVLQPEAPAGETAGPREVPSRGIETMFRTTYRNHISLSAIADSKANIMISINAILMSIIVSFVSTRLQSDAWLLVPAAAMLVTSLVAIVFAILSARPKVTSEAFSVEDVRANEANILFFGNFVRMDLADFTVGMKELMADWDRLYDSMVHDIYALGQVLSKKYRLLWLSYTVFMAGLIVTVAVFLALFVFIP